MLTGCVDAMWFTGLNFKEPVLTSRLGERQ